MHLKHLLTLPATSQFPCLAVLWGILFLILVSCGSSRSPWMKADGHEVGPREQLECVHQVNQTNKGTVLGQKVLKQRIEQCMLDKGYHRRQWWLLNDMH